MASEDWEDKTDVMWESMADVMQQLLTMLYAAACIGGS